MSAQKPITIERNDDLVTVTYYCAARHGKKYEMSFSMANLDWMTRSLETFTSVYGHPSVESVVRGDDCFTMGIGGDELRPVYFVQNRRPKDAPGGGLKALPLAEQAAYSLLDELVVLKNGGRTPQR
jgi:hypothetical protein